MIIFIVPRLSVARKITGLPAQDWDFPILRLSGRLKVSSFLDIPVARV